MGGRGVKSIRALRIGAVVRPPERDREEVGARPAAARGATESAWTARARAAAAEWPLDLARRGAESALAAADRGRLVSLPIDRAHADRLVRLRNERGESRGAHPIFRRGVCPFPPGPPLPLL